MLVVILLHVISYLIFPTFTKWLFCVEGVLFVILCILEWYYKVDPLGIEASKDQDK